MQDGPGAGNGGHDRPVAVVTGASDRIGAAIARRVALDGYRVVVHFVRNGEAAHRVANEIGCGARAVRCDLTDRGERAGFLAYVGTVMGLPPTLLVNNASVFRRDWAGDVETADWDEHFTLHAEAPVFLARDMHRLLPVGADGHVVNIIDERVLHPSPAYFSYGLSKSVLATATTMMAQSFAPRMRVNGIAPGPVLPHDGRTDEEFAAVAAALPLQRAATPGDIAETVSFLDRMKPVTGQIIAVDGGRHVEFRADRGPTPRQEST